MRTKARVLVMGATGQVGGALVPLLAREGHIEVVAAARTPGKAEQFGVPIVHLDLDKIETFAPALEGVDRIFMTTGYTIDMLRQSKDLVNTAKRAGVQQIIHLGACGDDDTRVAHYGWHQFIERIHRMVRCDIHPYVTAREVLMPSLCIRKCRVVRLMPRRAAAPLGPPIFPVVFSRAAMISCRSASLRVARRFLLQ